MSYPDKHIVESYFALIKGLSSLGKMALIKNLSESLKTDKKDIEEDFYKSFGAFASKKSAEEIGEEVSFKFLRRSLRMLNTSAQHFQISLASVG